MCLEILGFLLIVQAFHLGCQIGLIHSCMNNLKLSCIQFKVWVKPGTEQSFLYGNHVLKSGLGRITENTMQYQGVVVYSMADVPLVSPLKVALLVTLLWAVFTVQQKYIFLLVTLMLENKAHIMQMFCFPQCRVFTIGYWIDPLMY